MNSLIIGKDQIIDTYYPTIEHLEEERKLQEYDGNVLNTNNLFISTLAMDFPSNISSKRRKEIEEEWKEKLPHLNQIKRLNLRHKVDQEFFECICKMQNLEVLNIWTSTVTNIDSLKKLTKLKALSLSNCSRLEDISPLTTLRSLESLSILASFKVINYELIGKMKWLKSLELGGDSFAPKNLMLQSIEPFTGLDSLIELDLSYASIKDKNYRPILELKKLKRLDAHWRMKNQEREFIQNEHPSLQSGFFVAYDFVKNEFKDGIEWWKEK
ncbi:leucine-rich repeat domain-containing protein [Brumimicrobium mesophilum]|uniref:leucine-rich repeat domain-containing protein n=1 Tax=Brumimicrobium mesophilum TaxID=392717 RepID=UPI000D13ECCC|nr:leucine-rich repeat domain-containing protein [Brumimicrobium mesophilum]